MVSQPNSAGFCFGCARAVFAGTNFPQPFPRINSQLMAIVPVELDGVLADGLSRSRLHGGLEHGQLARFRCHRLSRPATGFAALLIA